MGIYEQAFGKAYANDPQYDNLSGRVVHQSTIIGITLDGWKVRHTVEYISLGRADGVHAADPDLAISSEGPKALGFREHRYGKTLKLIADVRDLLQQRPMRPVEIAEALNCTTTRIQKLFINQPDGFVVVLRGVTGSVWGLEGRIYHEPIYLGSMARIVAYLKEHGPSTAPQICAALGIVYNTFTNARVSNPGALRLVDKVKAEHANYRLVQIWALANERQR